MNTWIMDVLRMLNLIFCFLYKIELEIGQVACCCLAEAWNGQHTMKHDAILADRPIPYRGPTVDTSHPGALQRTVLTQGPYRGKSCSTQGPTEDRHIAHLGPTEDRPVAHRGLSEDSSHLGALKRTVLTQGP